MSEKGTKTKEKILREAYNLFARDGYKNVTMQQICDVTELSRGGLYRHYGSTEEIFTGILENLGEGQRENFEIQMREGIPAWIILNKTLARMEEEMMDPESSLSFAIYEFSRECSGEFMVKSNQRAREYWKKLIQYGMERKEFRTVGEDEVIDIIIFSYQGVRMWSQIVKLDPSVAGNIAEHIRKLLQVEGVEENER